MILQGNSIRIPLRDESVHAIVTSPPYWALRDYGTAKWVGGDMDCIHTIGSQVGQTNTGQKSTSYVSGIRPGTDTSHCLKCGAIRIDNQIGLEPTIAAYIAVMVQVFREVWRVLRPDGVCFVNLGDSYSGGKNGRSAADTKAAGKDDRTFRDKPFSVTELPAKNLCMIPARVALALQDDGWILRSEIPWLKANAMPSSVTDRPGTAHEHVFMLVKSARYYYDGFAVRRGKSQDSIAREKRGVSDDHKNTNGAPGQPPHSFMQFRPNDPSREVEQGRALRTSDPFFDSLDAYIAHLQDVRDNGGMLVDSEGLPAAMVVNTASYKFAHYATFSPKLIAPLIKTTPEKVCPECGKPWQRVVDRKASEARQAGNDWQNGRKSTDHHGPSRPGSFIGGESKTTGWQPACKCQDKAIEQEWLRRGDETLQARIAIEAELAPQFEPISAVILDCFCGSGTVGAVARELGRRFIGIDLSATYLAENALPRSEKKMSLKALGQLPMFREAA